MARPGRRRRPDARRRATTRAGRTRRDYGTAELRAQRAKLVGAAQSSDPRAAEPLGILSLAGLLTPEQVDAGWRYAVMCWRVFGKPMPDTRLYQRYLAGIVGPVSESAALGEAAERRLRAAFEEADGVLRGVGNIAWRETRRVAVEQRLPDWFWRVRLGQPVIGDEILKKALQSGLSALGRHWRSSRAASPQRGRR